MQIKPLLLSVGLCLAAFPSAVLAATKVSADATAAVAVGPQYDTTHVYVTPENVDRFAQSFLATFGGQSTPQTVADVTPTPSITTLQLLQTPVGTVSLFGFKTPVPYPFGSERNGFLVTDMDAAINAARQAGADVVVATFPDPIGRDAIIQWPGGVNMQLYWHTSKPSYAAFQTVPENRVYVSPDRTPAFLQSFLAFSHGKIVSDDARASGSEIGRPNDNYRRIRVESDFGKMTVLATDGHLPYPYGRETTGYEVTNLRDTLAKAKAAGVAVIVEPFASDGRTSAIVQFPGGYIAEIHASAATSRQVSATPEAGARPAAQDPITRADIDRWAAAWNSHDIETVMALFTQDIIIDQPSNPKPLDAANVRNFFSMIFKAYPDFHVDVTQALVDGQAAVSVERVTGTWSGPYTDPATGQTVQGNGRKFDHPGVMLLAYTAHHKISKVDIYWDRLTVAQQLDLKPE